MINFEFKILKSAIYDKDIFVNNEIYIEINVNIIFEKNDNLLSTIE